MVDKLIYLTNICPDLMFVVGVVSHHMAIPQEAHLDVVKHSFKLQILEYYTWKGLVTCLRGILMQIRQETTIIDTQP